MAVDTTNASELTQEQVQKILIQPLEAASVFLAAGPRIFDTANSLRIPKLGAATNPDWYGENELIDDEDVTFDEVLLLPSHMKSVKTLTRFSNELARQSVVALDQAIKDRLVRDVAAKLDHAFIAGAAAVTPAVQDTPLGILNYPGTQKITAVGDVTFDPFLDAWGKLLAANANPAAAKWFMRPETFVKLRKAKDGQQRYQMQPDPTQDGVFRLFGSQVIVTDRIPLTGTGATRKTSAFLADFSQVAVARDLAPTVKILDQTFGDYDQQAIRVVARYDAAPLNAEAVVVLQDVNEPAA